LEIGGAEQVLLDDGNALHSVFADGDGIDCAVEYFPGAAQWEKPLNRGKIQTTAFVPLGTSARVFQFTHSGEKAARLIYRFCPQLTSDRKAARFAQCIWKENHLVVQNPWNRAFWPQSMLVAASERPEEWHKGADGAVEMVWPLRKTLILVVGCAASPEEEQSVLALVEPCKAEDDLKRTISAWERLTGKILVETPDRELDAYLNRWAPYQTVACRLWGRTSRYQNGGAYGFRDQLQDVCAALFFAPELAKEQLLRACGHQFEEGDVQHWWHETAESGPGKGVRTRISDDLLWLPYTLCEYLEKTGDETVLDILIPYLSAPPLSPGERERYEQPKISSQRGSVYDHAVRAVELALARGAGQHGLALMGSGDWNDGMNKVGELGAGESVWLTWFLVHVLRRFAQVAEDRKDRDRAVRYKAAAKAYLSAAEAAWDGAWFLRGYYDDGTPLGSRLDEQCRIDSIVQSWAVIAGCDDAEKTGQALRSALEQLWDRDHRLVKLFTPSFDGNENRDPGYIADYVPGVRENGGQYTHAAVWLAVACIRQGLCEEGYELLHALLPSGRDIEVYKAEPYVLAADIYSNPQHLGRGGWSWYTGAAGWYYRAALEDLLGVKLRKGKLFLEPKLPQQWPGFHIRWKTEAAQFEITVRRREKKNLTLDGKAVTGGIDLKAFQGQHDITVVI